MGTRGAVGFRASDQDYLTYNHFDSYPSGLGAEVEQFLHRELGHKDFNSNIAWMFGRVRKLKAIDATVPPTAEDIKALAPWTDLSVSEQSTSDWYCLTRKMQGELGEILNSGYISLNNEFILESLFCEWAYIINLDSGELEVYTGFQEKYHTRGRYSRRKPRGWKPEYEGDKFWYPCALIATIKLQSIADGVAIDWEKIECGADLEHCHHVEGYHDRPKIEPAILKANITDDNEVAPIGSQIELDLA